MRDTLLMSLTSRTAILLVNLLLLALMVHGTYSVFHGLARVAETQKELEEILEGLGTILVAVGVALEERETLMKFLGLYPARLNPAQACVDHHCHGYGLVLLLVGLLVEVVVYLVRMPNLPTVDFDPALLALGGGFCLLGGLFLALLSWRLWQAPRTAHSLHG